MERVFGVWGLQVAGNPGGRLVEPLWICQKPVYLEQAVRSVVLSGELVPAGASEQA